MVLCVELRASLFLKIFFRLSVARLLNCLGLGPPDSSSKECWDYKLCPTSSDVYRCKDQAYLHRPVITVLARLRQQDHCEFEAGLS